MQPQSVPYAPSTQPFAATPKISMTDESVYVRYKLPATVDADKLRVFASSGQLRLEGIPNSRKQTITLPVPVTVQGSTARLAKDTLIVKLRKAFRSKEREIFIHFE